MKAPVADLKGLMVAHLARAPESLRRVGSPSPMAAADHAQLLADAAAGKDVRLTVDAVTFIQRDTPNRNHVRFRPGALRALAASFKGAPVLRDHQGYDAMSRAGTIVDAKLTDGAAGEKQFAMTFELSAPWAVDLALRGLMDRFSIAWNPTGALECSICGKDMMGWGSGCQHYPGQKLEIDGDERVVEGIFTAAEGTELSIVSIPAIVGTGVEGIRAALAAARELPHTPPNRKDDPMIEKIRTALGLPKDATDEQVLAAASGARITLAAEQQARAQAQTALADRDAQLAKAAQAQLAADTDRVIEDAIAAGKLIPKRDEAGNRVETAIETSIRHHAKTLGLASAKQIADSLPRVTPVGAPTRTGADPLPRDPAARTGVASGLEVDGKKIVPALSKMQRKLITGVLGVSLEDVAKYGGAPKAEGYDDDEEQAR